MPWEIVGLRKWRLLPLLVVALLALLVVLLVLVVVVVVSCLFARKKIEKRLVSLLRTAGEVVAVVAEAVWFASKVQGRE